LFRGVKHHINLTFNFTGFIPMKKLLTSLAFVVMAASSLMVSGTASAADAEKVYNYGGHSYQFFYTDPKTTGQAKNFCVAIGATLPVPNSAGEYDFLRSRLTAAVNNSGYGISDIVTGIYIGANGIHTDYPAHYPGVMLTANYSTLTGEAVTMTGTWGVDANTQFLNSPYGYLNYMVINANSSNSFVGDGGTGATHTGVMCEWNHLLN
jgi:hypothetical protein